jgi:uncharacterized protein with LGFP repeats
VQAFSAVTSYVALGAGVHSLSGGWQARYAALGGPTGFLGFPVSDPAAVAGGAQLAFQGGAMYGGPTGVHTMSAVADALYQRYGGPAGTLGLPVSDAVPVGSGVRQSLAHGDLWYSAATGLHVTLGAIGTYYTARGGAAGPLGFPRSDEFAGAIGREVLFQHGAVAYSPHYGVLAGPAVTAIDAAMSKLGAPYQWGAAGPDRFDCSGLVAWAFAQAGVRLPHFTGDQVKLGRRVDAAHLVPGDLVFFGADFGHVGIYLGDGRYVHAPHTGDVVRVSPIGATAPSAAVRLG